MSDDPVARVETAEAWDDFCETLKKAGAVLLRDDIDATPFEKGEGLRYLSRLLRGGLVNFAEGLGPKHPVLRAMPEGVKMGLDNPDNYYLGAAINPAYTYRLTGTRGSIHYLSFAAQNQNFAATDKITGGAGHLEDSELVLDSEGRFEIIASQKEHAGNWLRMVPDTKQILVRQTFLDRANEKEVTIRIECLDAEGAPPDPLDPARVPGALQGAALYAMGCAQWFANWVVDFRNHAPVNAFHLPDAENHRLVGGDPNVRLWLGLWELEPDQALVIEATPPPCHYWNFQLGNIWAESLDYRNRNVHLNSGSAVLEDDGSFRLVVAAEDPGVPNWLDTAGHHRGTMGVRWVRAEHHPEPRTRVVSLEDVRNGKL
ncbi:MAG: hypothetical protein QNK05_19075 [Myxococcota bacterium]|nr:hypothetical protein [Myxococcota bacterium]